MSTPRIAGPRLLAAALGLPPPTDEQEAVIAAPPGPCLVVAGAGAGKTETMAARVVWLVANGLVAPERVLGLTFTRKAARQLGERVRLRLRKLAASPLLDELDPSGNRRIAVLTTEPTVLTYHAYAGRLVAEHGLRLPVEPGARVLSETAAWQLADRTVSSWDDDLDTSYVPATVTKHVLTLAGELAEHLVSPEQLRAHAEVLVERIESAPKAPRQKDELSVKLRDMVSAQRLRIALLPLIEAYTRAKRAAGSVDFADQMTLAARLAAEHEDVRTGERQRFGAVLLDEYQDTGHAQRVLLRELFGSGPASPTSLPVTAVGDPAQAIYGWRGASAANLPRFGTDFPAADGSRAPRHELLTSFRNPAEVLALANTLADPLRTVGLPVSPLRARDGAAPGDVHCALLDDVVAEREWLADLVAQRWYAGLERDGAPPTTAVLVRRRADMAGLAAALRERSLPVEVVGLGGLLDEPEVRDLLSALRVVIDPLAGPAAARLLTGARWRLGAADLAALWARAGELAVAESGTPEGGSGSTVGGVDVQAALPGEHAEQAGLVDALDDPGEAERYSPAGFRRIMRLSRELRWLRRRASAPLTELVAEAERAMGLDVEAMARPGGIGRVHLDAFADVVADYAAASPSATLLGLLDYLAVAEAEEDGFEPGEVEVAADRVQLLTVHAAKGLEWDVVAVPQLCAGVFPGRRKSSSWIKNVTELPAELRGDAADLPELRLPPGGNRRELEAALVEHDEDFEERRLIEERRLCYVAVTRARHSLLLSAHWWSETTGTPRGPSPFLVECHAALTANAGLGTVRQWAEAPPDDAVNPLAERVRSEQWPVDPLGARRPGVRAGADLVLAELAALAEPDDGDLALFDLPGDGSDGHPDEEEPPPEEDEVPPDDPEEWRADVDVLLAERAERAERGTTLVLPDHLSVSQVVELAARPAELAVRLRRPLPFPPSPSARRGTAFHAWLEHRFNASTLLDLLDMPGAADDTTVPDPQLTALQEAFEASDWAHRTPRDVEVPFETDVDGVAVRGRMDAVFADPDGGWTVVDWKTGGLPSEEELGPLSVQLAVYRLAWSALSGAPLEQVRAVFHYVRRGRTLAPVNLLDAAGLRALIESVPVAGQSAS